VIEPRWLVSFAHSVVLSTAADTDLVCLTDDIAEGKFSFTEANDRLRPTRSEGKSSAIELGGFVRDVSGISVARLVASSSESEQTQIGCH